MMIKGDMFLWKRSRKKSEEWLGESSFIHISFCWKKQGETEEEWLGEFSFILLLPMYLCIIHMLKKILKNWHY